MDRRTTSAIVVLALAAIVVIAAWLLRADGAPTIVAVPPDPPPSVVASRTNPISSPARMPEVAAHAATTPPTPPSAEAPAPPAATVAAATPGADRLVTKEEKALRNWGPKGRVVEAGTGAPIPWKSVTIQVRDPRNPAAVEIRGTDRGVTPEGDAEPLSRFDLNGAKVIRGDATLANARPESLEFRIVVLAWGFRGASTAWQPLSGGEAAGEVTIALERDESAAIEATVRNRDGTPFRGTVAVDLSSEEGEYMRVTSGITDPGGRVLLEGLPSGGYIVTLRTRLAEAAGAWQCIHLPTEGQRVELPRGGAVAIEFVVPAHGEIEIDWRDAGGVPVRGSGLRIVLAEAVVDHSSGPRRLIGLRPGRIEIALRAEGYRPWKTTVDVVAGQVTKVEARFEKGEDPK